MDVPYYKEEQQWAKYYGMEVVGKEFALEHGKNLLQKPYNPQQLASIVRDSLDVRP